MSSLQSEKRQEPNKPVKILYTNARSIVNKIQELKLYVNAVLPDVIAITEAWIHDGISNDYLQIPDYSIVTRHDRNDTTQGRGGGILIYVHTSINACESPLSSAFNQYAGIEISKSDANSINLYIFYRSPNSSTTNNDLLVDALASIHSSSIVIGDFNYPGINWGTLEGNTETQRLIDTTLDKFWTQYVNFPTHKSGNILDLAFAQDGIIDEVTCDSPIGNSDHNVLMITTSQPISRNIQHQLRYVYGKADYKTMRSMFKIYQWPQLMHNVDIHEAWRLFKDRYSYVVDACIPQKAQNKKKRAPWMSNDLLRDINNKRRLWRDLRQHPTPENHSKFNLAQRALKKKIRKSKLNFEKSLAKRSKDNPKAFYAYIGTKRANRSSIGPLQDDHGVMITDNETQAKMFNQYYATVFEPENLPFSPNLTNVDAPMLQSVVVTEKLVDQEIQRLKRHGSPGPDCIANQVLVECHEELSIPLTILFKKSLTQGDVPTDWKLANVTPVFKGGSKKYTSNYRPISLTSVVCKVLESLIRNTIMIHLCENSLINSTQHGFMRRKSCLTNLLHCMEEVTSSLDDGNSIDILYLDFAKAFDKVQHQRLLAKLHALNITGEIYGWIRAWLYGRKQRVVLNGIASDWTDVLCSVGQGSVLGPILFLIYINDIDSCAEFVDALVLKFADDTKILKQICSPSDSSLLQRIISNLCEWARSWQMHFNVDKCKVLHLGPKNPNLNYWMDGTQIQSVTQEKDLGVIISDNAKPSEQCAKAAKKANQVLGQLLRSFQCRDRSTLVQLYKVFVRPHLEYAVQAWCPYTAKDIELMEKVQKRAIRQITNLRGSYEDKLKQLNLTTLEDRRKRGDCIETFKMLTGLSAVDYSIWFHKVDREEGPQTRLSSDPLALQAQKARLDLRKHFFSVRVPPIWNALPLSVRQSQSVNGFKNAYDKYMATKM